MSEKHPAHEFAETRDHLNVAIVNVETMLTAMKRLSAGFDQLSTASRGFSQDLVNGETRSVRNGMAAVIESFLELGFGNEVDRTFAEIRDLLQLPVKDSVQ